MRKIQQADGIRDAATVILLRREDDSAPRILMGQRNRNAIFMPAKFVFPGGAVDPQDHEITPAQPLPAEEIARLGVQSEPGLARVLALAAIRELWEEAGLALGKTGAPSPAESPSEWASFYSAGYRPDASALRFVYRAITPPGRTRRFDCRFFLADARALANDPDDFSRASDELSALSWLSLAEARRLDLPSITKTVLSEIELRLRAPSRPRPVHFHYVHEGRSFIERI